MKEWFPFYKEEDGKDNYLFCFHHAGGTAAAYHSWVGKSEGFNIIPVELPGKATRMWEPYIEDMDILAAKMADAIYRLSEAHKIYLFGHSMGAVLAFLAAGLLERQYKRQVELLIVAGRQPPHFPGVDKYHSDMGTDALLEEMKRLSGAPRELLESKELQEFVLPIVRRDYRLNESYRYGGEKVSCSIHAYCGREDFDAPAEVMRHWQEVTAGKLTVNELPGNHFFVTDEKVGFLQRMLEGV